MDDLSTLMQEILAGKGVGIAGIARLVPSFRPGRPTTPNAITRWILSGVPGPNGSRIKLEAVRLNRRWVSSPGALARFIAAQQSDRQANQASATPVAGTARRRGREIETAQRQLKTLGV
jgi:hypothetical protein